ncbi:Predicted ATP-dependent endonuclease of the OLD family, contains P-loop ATPase and TOPRIM domains [Moraxella cuniculi DSM 21768]|uniref:Predicted ATP-dependent endonuclease of the OLD family, contains P-loop ATPase and TOPRIM domains n=1 Tax=Moraxella cuniculi DSM 21768 TaxID=1122245 RepID=A0A1N7FS61_9GAMM|nr:AAA family ATPase [Moraxella cuniculi]OOS08354.1 ATP-dependent endonuclease [Moraxella cuniculi]SIS03106.1 Predicted ATP-dependent endonuclease of the OLD family, contains P-loop ATPase and TOPRIM domains [Moraxella cuniculi DSM 21768]
MKLQTVRLFNFQSFGNEITELQLDEITYLIGPNGSGKTAVLQALCRLFAFDPALRRIKHSDFHIPHDEKEIPEQRKLVIEADFTFPETSDDSNNSTVAPFFTHMRLNLPNGFPTVRFRLTATMDCVGEIEEKFEYVLDTDLQGKEVTKLVPRADRNQIQVHYLPAQREPSDHIAYSANALLDRLLRAVNWEKERDSVNELTEQINNTLEGNPSVRNFSERLKQSWESLHKGSYFKEPKISFAHSEIENILQHMSVSFTPGHDENIVDFSRLSDGQKSMLYLSLVLASQSISHSVLSNGDDNFDIAKLRPPIFTIIALEEPENSLSPHYLGRIVNALKMATEKQDAQALIATHAPTMLRRVLPEQIRYLRLSLNRTSSIKCIRLPTKSDEAHKFVREAVQAFPEIYFSRMVVLGEGDSEEIVLPRIFSAKGLPVDESAITIAPLGGRYVNHFWRLLSQLEIPYVTLLDLDVGRFGGGWGRIKYVNDQLSQHSYGTFLQEDTIPKWNESEIGINHTYTDQNNQSKDIFKGLEDLGVFFSYPMDLDFSMLKAYQSKFKLEDTEELPDEKLIVSVLGKSHHKPEQYSEYEQKLFATYHKLFILGSKPANHLQALANLTDEELLQNMPAELSRLADKVKEKLQEIPE